MSKIIDRVNVMNGFVVIDPIYTKPEKQMLSLLSPFTELETGPKESYEQHPFRALVIAAPKFFYNGGIRYEAEFKAGDILLMPGTPIILDHEGWVVIDGKPYPCVRYSLLYCSYTPTKEETENLVFVRDVQNKKSDLVGPGDSMLKN